MLPETLPAAGGFNTSSLPATRRAGPITTPTEFELLAEDAAGMPMPVYGRRLFDQVPTTFAPLSEAPVPADYVIGPGDELIIRIWGKIDLDRRVTVDRNGQFFLPQVGALSVAGLRFDQVESYVHAAVGNLYKDFNLNVTMGRLRSIQIFVLGDARQPGVYTVSSLSTLVDALFASGGPSAAGSMRQIEVRRGGRVVTVFDIYGLLRNGDKTHDVPLLPGDVIYIPPAGPQVAIMGSVNEPGIYELDGETSIAAALKDAGGLTTLAGTDRVLLERVDDHQRRRVDDFSLDGSAMKRVLRDGDMLRIFPISPQFDNAVTLRGNVAQPGRYPWHQGMRISDLIPSRDFLITRSYWIGQNHLTRGTQVNPGWNTQFSPYNAGAASSWGQQDISGDSPEPIDGRQLQSEPYQQGELDGIAVQSGAYGIARRRGASGSPLQSESSEAAPTDMMSDITRNNSEINWDYAAIERLDGQDLSTRLIAFNLGKALDNPASANNEVLRPGDVVTIFARRDLPLPVDKQAMFVRIDGEVNAPGVYRVHPGESLREVVEQAGGLTPHSY
ncbi:MAG TPA: SLBB domain-containing protein, partial [Acidobacteriaceae bacterium]|nr:SLBB domain-containing protein [Acidobacteriaceae bacterium]